MGLKQTEEGIQDVYKSVKDLVPLCDPNTDIVIHGWDISAANLYEAARRAHVLEPDLIR